MTALTTLRLGRAWPAAVGAGFIVLYVALAAERLTYPFALEWIESGLLAMTERIRAGLPLYGEPEVEYVPFIYPPLYPWVSAALSTVAGPGFVGPRLVSILASLALLGIVFVWVRRETGSARAGLTAAGMLAAAYRAGGAWLDIARVDSLFLALSFGALMAIRLARGAVGLMAAALLVTLAFHTKQQALLLVAPALAWAIIVHRAAGLTLTLLTAALLSASVWLLNAISDGWYAYYVLLLPARHENEWFRSGAFWSDDILGRMHVAVGFTLALLILRPPRPARSGPANGPGEPPPGRPDDLSLDGAHGAPHGAARPASGGADWHGVDPGQPGHAYRICVLAGALMTSWLSRIHWGGYENVLLPAYVALSIHGAIGLECAWPWSATQPACGRWRALLTVLALLQFAALAYNPLAQLPREADFRAGQTLVRRIAEAPGPVFIPRHPYLAQLAGKPGHMHWMAFYDLIRADQGPTGRRLVDELRRALEGRAFAAVLVDSPSDLGMVPSSPYEPVAQVFEDPGVLRPVTGYATRPELWCEAVAPKSQPDPPLRSVPGQP